MLCGVTRRLVRWLVWKEAPTRMFSRQSRQVADNKRTWPVTKRWAQETGVATATAIWGTRCRICCVKTKEIWTKLGFPFSMWSHVDGRMVCFSLPLVTILSFLDSFLKQAEPTHLHIQRVSTKVTVRLADKNQRNPAAAVRAQPWEQHQLSQGDQGLKKGCFRLTFNVTLFLFHLTSNVAHCLLTE